ncbi:ABC transporter ATP-binding protein [Variovorax ginsengisoli]|uniref:Branched-chain amino acid transport system ATP-binding protein n=1 Tax=Variovorax ginsengisoli TaxID=363844 RepID=A0ABT9S5U9_9BURK|nr:ABC transporter ATP-binding protein [Variovorax ginsengisoli]MDP9899738.1 branched-chain amino acid transport system ATP-binding protein [Variovorax ginsengisoli]
MTEPVLRIDQLVGGYGDLTILHGVDMTVPAGSWTTIIGANGAGKSTLLKAVAGIVRSRSGSILFEDRDVTALDSLARLKGGIGLVPQGRCNFPLLSVAENLKLGAFTRKLSAADLEVELQQMTDRFPRLKERWNTLAGNLSGGEQQIMEMAMVLLAKPRLLLLDEPSLGLSPQAMGMVFDTIRELTASGLSVLMVEQNARQALECCDYGVVMELGRNKLSAPAGDVLAHPDIRRMFLGL